MTQLYAFGRVGRDSRGRTVTVTYYTTIAEPLPVRGQDDAAEAHWVAVKDITALAFDHMEMLQMALERL
jgi:8-oxo-dGTP diphosphatase